MHSIATTDPGCYVAERVTAESEVNDEEDDGGRKNISKPWYRTGTP